MAIKVRNVGHVVLKVREIERAARFYRDVLGLKEVARANFGRPMAFFSTGDNHHDVAVLEVGPDAALPQPGAVGLYDARRAASGQGAPGSPRLHQAATDRSPREPVDLPRRSGRQRGRALRRWRPGYLAGGSEPGRLGGTAHALSGPSVQPFASFSISFRDMDCRRVRSPFTFRSEE